MRTPPAAWLAVAIAALTVAVTIRHATFTAWGTDQAAYVEAAARWAAGTPIRGSETQLWSPWTPHEFASAPLGFRRGIERGTDVSEYPLGLPVLMAAAIRTGGSLAPYLVAPIASGILAWSGYWIGAALAGPWAGLIAALLLAANPVTLVFAVQPMSDVPNAALWMLGWAMCLRPGTGAAAAAGAAVTAAVMIRPNLAPLAIVLAGTVTALSERTAWRQRLLAFGLTAAIGPVMIVWSQAVFYGHPLRPGYVGASLFYRLAHIEQNLAFYPRLIGAIHSPAIFIGLAAGGLLWSRAMRARLGRRGVAVITGGIALVAITYALYLPYLPMRDLMTARFMLPAIAALAVLLAGVTVITARALRGVAWPLAVLAAAPVLAVLIVPIPAVKYALAIHREQAHARIAGHYLDAALPANAAVLASMQSTAVAHYTRRLVVRLDGLAPAALDGVIQDLRRRGYYPVMVVDGQNERNWINVLFGSATPEAAGWPPRATIGDAATIVYLDPADRERVQRGTPWPSDLLRTR